MVVFDVHLDLEIKIEGASLSALNTSSPSSTLVIGSPSSSSDLSSASISSSSSCGSSSSSPTTSSFSHSPFPSDSNSATSSSSSSSLGSSSDSSSSASSSNSSLFSSSGSSTSSGAALSYRSSVSPPSSSTSSHSTSSSFSSSSALSRNSSTSFSTSFSSSSSSTSFSGGTSSSSTSASSFSNSFSSSSTSTSFSGGGGVSFGTSTSFSGGGGVSFGSSIPFSGGGTLPFSILSALVASRASVVSRSSSWAWLVVVVIALKILELGFVALHAVVGDHVERGLGLKLVAASFCFRYRQRQSTILQFSFFVSIVFLAVFGIFGSIRFSRGWMSRPLGSSKASWIFASGRPVPTTFRDLVRFRGGERSASRTGPLSRSSSSLGPKRVHLALELFDPSLCLSVSSQRVLHFVKLYIVQDQDDFSVLNLAMVDIVEVYNLTLLASQQGTSQLGQLHLGQQSLHHGTLHHHAR
ncbi:unnamed protein product [Tilletia caries]|nr:unnamed protein product [Tilletia caries]